jgi:hypothetical protein
MFSRKITSNVLLLGVVFVLFSETAQAKWVYVINDTDVSQMQAYKINGMALIRQQYPRQFPHK